MFTTCCCRKWLQNSETKVVFLFFCFHTGLCQNFAESFNTKFGVETDEPQFITKGHLYRAVVGDTITLPCKVKNLGTYILLWRRGAAVLTAANLMVSRDTRLKMVDGFSLQISDVKISDAGDYGLFRRFQFPN